jgi:mono/diheme cytochrome c family protein
MRYSTAAISICALPLLVVATAWGQAPKIAPANQQALDQFESRVRPILIEKCVSCHGAAVQQSGLRLDFPDGAVKGGKRGVALVAGKPEESRLIAAVRHTGDLKMPPGGKLSDVEIVALETWVKAGAPWPKPKANLAKPANTQPNQWWSFRPVKRPTFPPINAAASLENQKSKIKNPIDRFIDAKLAASHITPLSRGDRRTVLRRATYDLTGLPPTEKELSDYLKDTSPDAWEKVIERLLASPAYGERWGRHWLDLVRYADTAGETADFPVPQAWRYRDWVIGAINADMPYNQFVRQQVAGDILAADQFKQTGSMNGYASSVIATGYLAIARRFGFDVAADHYLTLEDTIDTLGKSILGLTLGCARCHDHKYDPVSTADYYALYGIFESTKFTLPGCEKEKRMRDMVRLMPAAEMERRNDRLRREVETLRLASQGRTQAANERLQQAARQPETVVAKGDIPDGGSQRWDEGSADGLKAPIPVKRGETLQWVVLPKTNHGADSTLLDIEITDVATKLTWNPAADTVADLAHWKQSGNAVDRFGHADTWTAYDPVDGPHLLYRLVEDANGTPGLIGRMGAANEPSVFINSRDTEIPYFTRTMPAKSMGVHPGPKGAIVLVWRSPIDGEVTISGRIADLHPGGGDGVAWQISRRSDLFPHILSVQDAERDYLRAKAELDAATSGAGIDTAYAVSEGDAHNAQLQKRGNPEDRGDTIPRRIPAVFGGQPVPTSGGSGRLMLADWLTSPSNPLTARVMVNRIWDWHFGSGLVRTPNDFGTRGDLPTHPELLDWLASEFVKRGWSLKEMHRLIMTSEAYRRGSNYQERLMTAGARRDPQNKLHWKFDRRRLSAEEIRDTLLQVSGDMDRSAGGPHPFPAESSWGYTQHGPFLATYETNRRSVYLMVQRIRRHPFLGLFDGADASASTPERTATTVPTQALFFMNSPFFHERAVSLAKRIAPVTTSQGKIERAYELVYGRRATRVEIESGLRFIGKYQTLSDGATPDSAWPALMRILLASNELIYVD